MKSEKLMINSPLDLPDDIITIIKTASVSDKEISGYLIKSVFLEYEDLSYLSFSGCRFVN